LAHDLNLIFQVKVEFGDEEKKRKSKEKKKKRVIHYMGRPTALLGPVNISTARPDS
jgi:ribosomal protein L13E